MTHPSAFWDALAPHHAGIEDNFLDLRSLRLIAGAIQPPVLVVGAGQGLLVGDLQKRGLQCDGIDLSPEMIRQAKLRRGLDLMEADARALPFGDASYRTIIYATGVIDFLENEGQIRAILTEGRRVVKPGGKRFVAFYRFSRALERFVAQVGLLQDHLVSQRRSLEMYLLNPIQMVGWVAERARISRFQAFLLLLGMSTGTTFKEKTLTFRMQKVFRNPEAARALLEVAPEKAPYRDEAEIRRLFERLAIPIRQIQASSSCRIVEI